MVLEERLLVLFGVLLCAVLRNKHVTREVRTTKWKKTCDYCACRPNVDFSFIQNGWMTSSHLSVQVGSVFWLILESVPQSSCGGSTHNKPHTQRASERARERKIEIEGRTFWSPSKLCYISGGAELGQVKLMLLDVHFLVEAHFGW